MYLCLSIYQSWVCVTSMQALGETEYVEQKGKCYNYR